MTESGSETDFSHFTLGDNRYRTDARTAKAFIQEVYARALRTAGDDKIEGLDRTESIVATTFR